MSPEQTRGEPPTTASDIFSLGSMLYELVCGGHPFRVRFAHRHRLRHRPPQPQAARPGAADLPAGLSQLLLDMMGKPAALRPNAQEVVLRLAKLDVAAPRGRGLARAVRSPVLWIGAALVAIAAASWWLVRHPILHRRPLVLSPSRGWLEKNVTAASLSPDGSRLVYAMTGGPVYLRRMSDGGTAALRAPSALRASRMAWFADGKQILISGSSGNVERASVWTLAVNSADAEPVLVTNQGGDAAPSPDGSRSPEERQWRHHPGDRPRWRQSTRAPRRRHRYVVQFAGVVAGQPAHFVHDVEPPGATAVKVRLSVRDHRRRERRRAGPAERYPFVLRHRAAGRPHHRAAVGLSGHFSWRRTDRNSHRSRHGSLSRPIPYAHAVLGDGVFSSLSVSNDGASMALVSRSGT